MPRPHLVVVRAGETSLHRNWLNGSATRSWDLVVSWFGRKPYAPVADERWIAVPGGPLIGLRHTFDLLPDLLDTYDYVWLPDDDIDTDSRSIDRLFQVMREEKLLVAQPSLTMNSYYSWLHTLNCAPMRLRYTNLVEMMAPCFDAHHLKGIVPHIPTTFSGWGLDQVWTRLAEDNDRKAAIIDAVAVHHTRPAGTLLGIIEKAGQDPREEGEALRRSFGLRGAPSLCCYAGKFRFGGPEIGRQALARLMRLSYSLRAYQNPDPALVRRHARDYVADQAKPCDLSRLTPPPLEPPRRPP